MNYLFVFLKGIAMGAADVVPGVSGGTIAFITGIYHTLLTSIQRINPTLISLWKQKGFVAVLEHINAKFLLALGAGIAFSILTLAKLILWLLVHQPILLWSFFLGLILISIVQIVKQIQTKKIIQITSFILGAILAYAITVFHPIHIEPTAINLILAGSIAICAMILPGISGSFILLLLGLYPTIIGAIKALDLSILSLFAIGAIVGLLTFSHLLSWLLKHHNDATLAFLVGLMIGTLPKIWPWKQTLTWRTNSSGEQVPLIQENLFPQQFEQLTGQSSQLFMAIVCFAIGVLSVWLLEKLSHNKVE